MRITILVFKNVLISAGKILTNLPPPVRMKSLIASGLVLVAGLNSLAVATESSSTAVSTGTPNIATTLEDVVYNNNADDAVNPLQMGSMATFDSPRHRQEKAHLMKRMSRKHGTWNTVHPRYRLLEALYGFSKYRERNLAELNRWRSMYSNVSKAQKKVCFTTRSKTYIHDGRRWRKQ
jgi:hypothetical protein